MSISSGSRLLVAVLGWLVAATDVKATDNPISWLSIALATDGLPVTEEHPALALALKKAAGHGLLMESRLVLSPTLYGIFDDKHTPRPYYGSLSGLIGILPGGRGSFELATGIGVVAGQKQGELYFHHRWGNGLFAPETYEHRGLEFVDVGLPIVAQWRFTRRRTTGLGFDLSCLWSPELFCWNLGMSLQFGLGGNAAVNEPPPRPVKEESMP